MNKWGLGSISNVLLASLLCYAQGAIVPPPWADPNHNPCASQPGGWQLIYWPADKKCYRIFQRGYPCPETMELSPGPDKGTPECNCPPGTAQHHGDSLCYPIFQQGPCEPHQYFAPEPDRPDRQRLGRCVTPESCTDPDHLYHPRDKRCHPKLTKGPCPEGLLLTSSAGSSLLGECRCDVTSMGDHYWGPGGSCHEHYSTGPCQERGGLFLPGGLCGCSPAMPHFHNATSRCYQLGGIGPCSGGHQFVVRRDKTRAECACRDGYVKWVGDGVCYRPYTRGPCPPGHMYSVNHTSSGMDVGCVPVPCSSGKLFFPGGKGCHRVGTQGPCPAGQLVLFQDTVKTSVEGISYLGMCGCARYNQENTLFPTPFGSDGSNACAAPRQSEAAAKVPQLRSKEPREDICVNKRGMITWSDGTCRQLYAQGPCSAGEWVVPDRGKGQRQGRGWWKGKCECRPGYTVTIATGDGNDNKTLCQAPTVVLAKFLNNKTHGYKYKNKHNPPQEVEDEDGNRLENPPSPNRYTTKLSNVRNNSKVTKLASLRTEEDRPKLTPTRSDRRNSRYKTSWEARELSRMKELGEKNKKNVEEKVDNNEEGQNKDDNTGDKVEGNSNNGDTNGQHKDEVEKTSTPTVDNEDLNEQDRKIPENTNELRPKEINQETNDIIRKIKAINSNNKHSGATHSRELGGSRRINSKELNIDTLSTNDQKLLESNENRNNRRGRKYNPTQNSNTNNEDETYRNLKTIQDDINEYIRQQQKQEEQEDRLKNHKLIDEEAAQNEDNREVETNNAKEDTNEEKVSEIGTEEFDTNVSLEVIKEANENLKKSDEESKKTDDEGIKQKVDNKDDFEELEGNSTETLIMQEDKKTDVSEYDHRKHIKDYVKPIIIFE